MLRKCVRRSFCTVRFISGNPAEDGEQGLKSSKPQTLREPHDGGFVDSDSASEIPRRSQDRGRIVVEDILRQAFLCRA
jgi:hypothetical protein